MKPSKEIQVNESDNTISIKLSGFLCRNRIASCELDLETSKIENQIFQTGVVAALKNKALICAKKIKDEKTIRKLGNITGSNDFDWCGPEHFWLLHHGLEHKLFIDMFLAKSVDLLIKSKNKPPPKLKVLKNDQFHPWVKYGIEHIQNELRIESNKLCFLNFPRKDAGEIKPKIIAGLELIKKYWPEAGKEMELFTRSIVILNGSGLKSSTVPHTFGAIYVCPTNDWLELNFADLILHEAAHHVLHIKSSFLRFLNNPNDLAKSPFREEKRPLDSIVHAVFVLVRVQTFLFRLLAYSEIKEKGLVIKLVNSYQNKLDIGIHTLKSFANWTPWGKMLFNSLQNKY